MAAGFLDPRKKAAGDSGNDISFGRGIYILEKKKHDFD
jgi:hypothetical protein